MFSAVRRFEVRAYRVTNDALVNKTVGDLERLPREFRVFVLRVRRQGALLEAEPSTVIRRDDVVAVATRRDVHVERGGAIGPEVQDRDLLDIPLEMLDVVVTNKALAGKSLAELARGEFARGVFLRRLTRAGEEMPVAPETRVDRGDVMSLIGSKPEVERAAKAARLPRSSHERDGHDLRRHRHRPRGLRRPPVGDARGGAAHPHGQRRGPDHGSRVRLAPIGEAVLRPDPGGGDLDLRHRRPVRLHRRGGDHGRPGLRDGAPEDRASAS